MKEQNNRTEQLLQLLAQRIVFVDSAMGTALQNMNLQEADYGGEQYFGCSEALTLFSPGVLSKIHTENLEAGADIIETNTFGGTALVLDEYGLGDRVYEINVESCKIARACCAQYDTIDSIRFVAGSMGPTTKAFSITGGVSFAGLVDTFYCQAQGLWDGGCDYFLIETCQDMVNVKAAVVALKKLFGEKNAARPIAISGTIEPMGTTLGGQGIESFYIAIEHLDLLYVGLNCATGPSFMTDHLRSLSQRSRHNIACVPNAGLPDEDGNYLETPDMLANKLANFAEKGWLNVVGGCCGTTPSHISAMIKILKHSKPRVPRPTNLTSVSGIDLLDITPEKRPILVGERTNVIGSRLFRTMIADGKLEEAAEVGRNQIKSGAQVLDVCLSNPDREELDDITEFMPHINRKVKAPLMIDSTNIKVFERALQFSQGKLILNSVNFEDGEEKIVATIQLMKLYGAAVVVGTIDEDPEHGMAVSRKRKAQIARRAVHFLTTTHGIPEYDVIIDPLVFPCGTGKQEYVGSAVETIEGIRLIKYELPAVKTILGVSNVSFGLPPVGREVLNSVFLYECVQAGLDLAIVNSQKIKRYASISEEEKTLCMNLLYDRGSDPLTAFVDHFRGKKIEKVFQENMPLDERLKKYIVEGGKDGLIADLEEMRKTMRPLEIINGPLMLGMKEVGRLFNNNQLIVAEVLGSAESMKVAVSHLEQFLEKSESAQIGKMLLATVKGDVHDIGKNLVEIIFSNNGFKVINLGIKVPPEKLIAAYKEHQPDLIGLSGLLVKSAHQMVATVSDFKNENINVPVIVGGAALSKKFVYSKIFQAYDGIVLYAKDAMYGLKLAQDLLNPMQKPALVAEMNAEVERLAQAKNEITPFKAGEKRSVKVPYVNPPVPLDFQRHVITNTPVDLIWKYINLQMLFGKHLGFRGSFTKALKQGDEKALQLAKALEEVKQQFRPSFRPKAVFQFFRAQSEGNRLDICHESGELACSISFERQPKEEGLCLADYVNPKGLSAVERNDLKIDQNDTICMFVVTAGHGIMELAEELKEKGDYVKSHMVQSLALESAEAYAEFIHSMIRGLWCIPDDPNFRMAEILKAKYRSKRYSFGYPACPNLEDNKKIFDLLKPEYINCHLTEGYMMDPEASVSAIVFHHPNAIYFNVGSRFAGAEED